MTATMTTRPRGRLRRRLNHVPAGLLGTGVVFVGAVVIAWAVRGEQAALGAAVGAGGVAVSYVLSGLAVAWADTVNPQLTMPVGLTTYAVKFAVLGVVLVAFSDSTWPGLHPMAFTILAAVLGWNAGHLWWAAHAKIPYVDLDPQA